MENRENWNRDEKKKERKKEEGRRGRRRNLLVQVSLVSWKTNIKKEKRKAKKKNAKRHGENSIPGIFRLVVKVINLVDYAEYRQRLLTLARYTDG